jgi:NDP-sugar pyrophosphorylase family protein
MKAVVLVGGEGTRLRPLTYTTPKPLLPVANIPFLERQLAWLAHHGVDEVVLSMGYLPDAFVTHFPGGRFGSVTLRYAVEDEPLGTAGGIRFAAEQGGIDERVVVCNGDVLTGLDLGELLRFHIDRDADATIHLAQVPDPSAYGLVTTTTTGEVEAFVEKPPPGEAPTDWINAGTYVLEPSVLDRIPEGAPSSIERETFPALLREPGRLYALQSDEYWIDVGTPEKYLEAHADLLGGCLGPSSRPADARQHTGTDVWVQAGAILEAGVIVDAPVLIGRGSNVEAGARVTESVVGAGCTVARDAGIVRSVLLDGARVDDSARVVDSVIGPGAVVEAGASVSDVSVIGARAVVAAGTHEARARVQLAGSHAPSS